MVTHRGLQQRVAFGMHAFDKLAEARGAQNRKARVPAA